MSRIPEHHRAARELEETFARLGRERAGRRAPGGRRAQRAVMIALAALLLSAAVAGAVRLLTDDGPPVPGERQLPNDIKRAPADRSLALARADDPHGSLSWGLRSYASSSGGRCLVAGRLKDGRLGVLRDGRFRPFASDAPGVCSPRDAHSLVANQVYPGTDPRTALFGFVDRTITSARVQSGGRSTPVPIATDGTFLVVWTGTRPPAGTLILKGPTEIRRPLGN